MLPSRGGKVLMDRLTDTALINREVNTILASNLMSDDTSAKYRLKTPPC